MRSRHACWSISPQTLLQQRFPPMCHESDGVRLQQWILSASSLWAARLLQGAGGAAGALAAALAAVGWASAADERAHALARYDPREAEEQSARKRTAAHAAGTAGNLDVDVVVGPVRAFEQCSLKAKWIMLAISSV